MIRRRFSSLKSFARDRLDGGWDMRVNLNRLRKVEYRRHWLQTSFLIIVSALHLVISTPRRNKISGLLTRYDNGLNSSIDSNIISYRLTSITPVQIESPRRLYRPVSHPDLEPILSTSDSDPRLVTPLLLLTIHTQLVSSSYMGLRSTNFRVRLIRRQYLRHSYPIHKRGPRCNGLDPLRCRTLCRSFRRCVEFMDLCAGGSSAILE